MNPGFDIGKLSCFTDLHLHIDGAITPESARKLADAQGIAYPEDEKEFIKLLRVDPGCKDLTEFLEKFAFPCSLMMSKDGVRMAVENLLAELKEGGVMYAELKFAPQLSVGKGISQEDAVEAAIEGLENAEIPAQLILCCMRGSNTHEANLETIRLVEKYLGKGVCAADLAGAEALFPNEDYADIFEIARAKGLPFTFHAGEAAGPESIRSALKMGPNRIGHGIHAYEDPKLVKELASLGIPLELCPTSNIQTCVFGDIAEYPLKQFMAAGVFCTINTDDPGIEGTNIRNEFQQLIDKLGLTKDEIKILLRNSVKASFAGAMLKEKMLAEIEQQFNVK